jgi:TRAP-type C4-dicarboxylate transport system permease small subunit
VKRTLIKMADASLQFGAAIGSLTIWIIGVIIFYDVVMRFMGRPTIWALEVSTYLMVGSAVLASGLAVTTDAHFSVRLLPEALGKRARSSLDLAINVICAALMTFVCYGFFELFLLSVRLDMKSPTLLQVPLAIPQAVVLFGFMLMVVGFTRKILARAA